MSIEQSLRAFTEWWRDNIDGYEKGEAQTFIDRLMQAFGHAGALEVGGYEERIRRRRNGKTTVSFADYLAPNLVLLEMKQRGEDLSKHYTQIETYWKSLDYKRRPRYALLCNFDEIWIFDFVLQFYDPVDVVQISQLADRRAALEFLVKGSPLTPVFNNNRVEVTKDAAFQLTELYHSLEEETGQEIAQRYTLQCMIAMFAEDTGLLPDGTLRHIISICENGHGDTDNPHDLMTLLFTMMNYPKRERRGGRFYNVDYFNGGIFEKIHPIALGLVELRRLEQAAAQDWSKVRPSIFGNIFEYSLDNKERHREGAHYTSEVDIKRIVDPVIVDPWLNDIDSTNDLADALELYDKLCNYIVLDPACGSGNFLYVAYREMKALEADLRERIAELGGDLSQLTRRVTAQQFYGYDINPFAVELAKVSLMIAKKLAVDEFETDENPLPLDNLDNNIKAEDALFNDWVEFDACIGNPPYLGNRRFQEERGLSEANRVYEAFPDVPHVADYCVYWFRKVHDRMTGSARAGLVGTNSISRTKSREASLDYIVGNGGIIYDAVQSMPWSGEASVDVSIVNWTINEPPIKPIRLHVYSGTNENGEYQFNQFLLTRISSSLSEYTDITGALSLACNREPKSSFQGQTTGYNPGFLIEVDVAQQFLQGDERNKSVVLPYLNGEDYLSIPLSAPRKYVIDFKSLDIVDSSAFSAPFRRVRNKVLPFRKHKAAEEIERNSKALERNPSATPKREYQNVLKKWWQHHRARSDLARALREKDLKRYILTSRAATYRVFDFVSREIVIADRIQAFIFDDDYTFGILHSVLHCEWWKLGGGRRGTLNYGAEYVAKLFETFPFPQQPDPAKVKTVALAGRALHEFRRQRMATDESKLTLRDMYRTLEQPGANPLRDLHKALDEAVLAAYGFDPDADILEQLLALNFEVADRIEAGEPVTAPGIPPDYPDPTELVSDGCIQPPELI